MKKIILLFLVVTFASCKDKQQIVSSQKIHPMDFVFDEANFFTINEKDSLNLKLKEYELKTTNEIVIITKDSVPKEITSYSVSLANQMGIGKKDKNNGLLILLLKNSKQVRITTGYRTERILTDTICLDIIDKQIIPEFKKGNFHEGIDKALDKIFLLWKDE